MYRILVKQHITKRFRSLPHRWTTDEDDAVYRYAHALATINYQVKIETEGWAGWSELKTITSPQHAHTI